MFCPQCKAEYRQGFTRCSDCDVDLVYSQPPESPEAADSHTSEFAGREDDLRLIWKGNDESASLGLCRDVMKTDILYKVAQTPTARRLNMRMKWLYEISVPHADYLRAKDLLGIEGEFMDACYDEDNEEEAQAADTGESIAVDDSPPDPEPRNDYYLKHWYPEDATVEIWAQDGDDISDGIAMALKENLIHCRSDHQDGIHKAFVLPGDEQRAREIIREIIEGEPPSSPL